jgi:hypothetical protein
VIPRSDRHKDAIAMELGQFILQGELESRLPAYRIRSQRKIDGRDGILEGILVVMHPLQSRFDPGEVASALVIKHAQGNQVHIRRDARVLGVVTADDARHMRTVKTSGSVIEWVCIAFFREIPTPNDAISLPKSASKCRVIIRNSAVDYRNRLAPAR